MTDDVLSIGRRTGNHICINDPTVSLEHAKILRVGADYVLIDLGSCNGTFVNGQRVRDLHILRDGDRIEIVTHPMQFFAGITTGNPVSPPSRECPATPSVGTANIAKLLMSELWLTDQDLTLGRKRDNRIVIDDPRVSNQHATIVHNGDDYWLFDLHSRNGTFVNDRRVRYVHRLADGDRITIAATHFTFVQQMIQIDTTEPKPDGPCSFVFADRTGRRWSRVRLAAALGMVALVACAVLFFWFINQ